MSVCVEVQETNPPGDDYSNCVFEQENVIGRVLALVVKHYNGSITLERDIAVSADNADDNELAEATVKAIEAKLNEAFPDPNQPQPSKLWVPGQ
jgi:hypothetical protein